MGASIIDGKAIAAAIRKDLKARIAASGTTPGLAVVLVGDDPASEIYVRGKRRDCEEVGINCTIHNLSAQTEAQVLHDLINDLNLDPAVDGILVQSPLPDHLDESAFIEAILPHKDVDGFHPYNIGRLAARKPVMRSCTPKGVMHLLAAIDSDPKREHALVVGASNHVGRPMALELLLAGATVTCAHKFTTNLPELVAEADLLVSATGRPHLIHGEWVKPGAVVIDIGITRRADGTLCGDVAFEAASERASWITPVPGGVGPMTRAALLENTVEAAELHHHEFASAEQA